MLIIDKCFVITSEEFYILNNGKNNSLIKSLGANVLTFLLKCMQ